MIENKQVLVVIPARGGSKSIPGKNIRFLADKPLVAHVISTVKQSKYVDKVVVSTDDTKIQFIASKYGASTLFRSSELARDDVPLDPVIYDAVVREEKMLMDTFENIRCFPFLFINDKGKVVIFMTKREISQYVIILLLFVVVIILLLK